MINFIRKVLVVILVFTLLGAGVVLYGWYTWFSAPASVIVTEPRLQAAVVVLDSSKTLNEFLTELQEKNVIKSTKVAMSVMQRMRIEKNIKQGIYVFKGGESVLAVLDRMSRGAYGYTPTKVTIPEGFTVSKMAETFSTKLTDIKAEEFESKAAPLEGYLFPDTYFFYPYVKSDEVIVVLSKNFEKQFAPLRAEILAANAIVSATSTATGTPTGVSTASSTASSTNRSVGHNEMEIIIMASILEKEVQTAEDKAMVADLFWRRLAIGMALQADSTLTYVTGKTSDQLTIKDLKENSPYNSYTNKGLPPTPISNPGIQSIKAAMHPLNNNFLYFLSDNEGKTHFSKTYNEHLKLKKQYLD